MCRTKSILARNYWVFDLDGTLTLPVHDFAAIRRVLGVPQAADILGHLASLPARQARPLHDQLSAIETELLERTAPAPGLVPLLAALRERGARAGILTRNTRSSALRVLERLGVGGYFPGAFVMGREEAPPKPAPEGLHRLAGRWNTVPAEMVMVGDYLFDLQAGRHAGAATVHVDATRRFPWTEWTDVGVGTLDELCGLLTGPSGQEAAGGAGRPEG